ncbi:MAG: PfaD family polyunsaturated fatty acid/polyketide biosynthesis protein [Polyangiaceae bacterium]
MASSASGGLSPVGVWQAGAARPAFTAASLAEAIPQVREPVHVVRERASGRLGIGIGGTVLPQGSSEGDDLMATLPALYPEWLGERSFNEAHGVRFAYVAGEMANGIATTSMVIAMARAQMLGFYGAAGLGFERVKSSVDELVRTLGDSVSWGVNLIHSPNEPALEDAVAGLLIERGVKRISASAFMNLTPSVVRCSAAGLRLNSAGQIVRARHVFAKISRAEVASRFMAPAPLEMLRALESQGLLTREEVELAQRVPVAEDISVEADSGGHTDNQALTALFPSILGLRDELVAKHGFTRPIRIGAGGGLGTPSAVAAAFGLGAAYVLTGSVNQASIEAGISEAAKQMLAQADVPDVTMAPAADMFELGVKVQVLKRGTMFASRASRLYDAYVAYPSLDAIPPELRSRLEREVLHATFDEIWADTAQFWGRRDPGELTKAESDPKHKMALVFRWYLGKASKWAIDGEPTRRTDYQIWCGPAMGAFNRWTAGSFLAEPSKRDVVQIARNLLEGAAVITRAQQLRTYGVPVPAAGFQFKPRPLTLATSLRLRIESLVRSKLPVFIPSSFSFQRFKSPCPWHIVRLSPSLWLA